ncbi:DGQHR domain-containing protein [Candidatus Falkowbacteria bacterium]|nr:DGQHR domain-containing protein [Candidatus Falkowbacteria bacterium]
MEEFKLKAFKVIQNGRQFYVSTITCEQLLDEDTFRTDIWKEELKNTPSKQGYQREPSQNHVNGVVKYMAGDNISIFPTSILLNCRYKIPSRENGSIFEITIDRPLWIVDGQHRIYGIRKAIQEKGLREWKGFSVPVVILDEFDQGEELAQFKVINESQKGISTGLLQWQMYQQYTRDPEMKDKYKSKIWQVKALMAMDKLNDDDNSPWKNHIQLPNVEKRRDHSINQTSFVTSLKPLFKDGFLSNYKLDDSVLVLKNYWKAVSVLFPEAMKDHKHYLLLKTPGIFPLHLLANEILPRCNKDVSIEKILEYLKVVFKDQKYSNEFWSKKGRGAALLGSMKGFKRLADDLIMDLPEQTLTK